MIESVLILVAILGVLALYTWIATTIMRKIREFWRKPGAPRDPRNEY